MSMIEERWRREKQALMADYLVTQIHPHFFLSEK